MSDKDSSDEEDVFECGRCKEKFTDMTVFVRHKKDKSCTKAKKQKDGNTEPPGVGHERILLTPSTSALQEREQEQESTSLTRVSPSISEIFASKVTSRDTPGEPSNLPLDILNALDNLDKSELRECALCQEWLPSQEALGCHLREKHDINQQADEDGLVDSRTSPYSLQKLLEGKQSSSTFLGAPTSLQKCKPRRQNSKNLGKHLKIRLSPQADLEELEGPKKVLQKPKKCNDKSVGRPALSRRSRPDHSCDVCSLKFLSRYKLEQHMNSRKHQNAVVKKSGAGKREKAVRGRKAKQRLCNVCQITTSSVKELKQHMKEEHKDIRRKGGTKGNGTVPESSKNLCGECGTLVATKSLKRHEKRCANRKRYECPLCRHQSRESTDYKYHIDNHKVWIDMSKINDEKVSESEDQHTPSKHKEETVTIQSAGESISLQSLSPTDLAVLGLLPKRHIESLSDEDKADASDLGEKEKEEEEEDIVPSFTKRHPRQRKCKWCVQWFTRSNLSKHMHDKHNMVKRFQCRELSCLLTYDDMESFKEHIVSHSEKLMFQCGCRQCIPHRDDVEPDYPEAMRKFRMRQYYSEMTFKCSICWTKFPSEYRLIRHQQLDSHQYRCEKCGKVTVSKRQLRLHMEVHREDRCYLCDMCGSGYKTVRDLRRHIASHSSERPFVCKDCGKGFLFKNKLTRHEVSVHSTNKPFSCDQPGCPRTFARRDKLNEHRNVHKNVPPFSCGFCEKAFYRKDSAKEHEIIAHTKDFPYNCTTCKKGFLRPRILENHQTTEHGKNGSGSSLANLLRARTEVRQRMDNSSNFATLKLMKAHSEAQQRMESLANMSSARTSSLSYVICEPNLGAVLQGTGDTDAQSIQTLQTIPFSQASATAEAHSNEITYQMADITGSSPSGLMQISHMTIPDNCPQPYPVSITELSTE